jgi:DNA-binding beta-propeller fold protein YncE
MLSSIGTQIAQLVVSTQENSPTGISFNETGTKVYVIGTQRDIIFEYTLGAPWSIATGAYSGRSLLVSSRESDPHGVFAIGEHLYVCGSVSDLIHQYSFTRETPNFEATVQEIIF